jgi:peptide-methionine (S)-S-oxide reductase
MKLTTVTFFTFAVAALFSCAQAGDKNKLAMNHESQTADVQSKTNNSKYDTATFGAGCFWCVEAQFQMLDGVESVKSGFSGGHVKNPSYREVCNGTTGHAEVCQVVYDTSKLSYKDMLEAFWKTHDPTQLNRQGNDVGTQYRSAIFYHNDEQKRLAEEYKEKLNKSGAYENPVVTEIAPYTVFYKAEDYHQNYYNENGDVPYCRFVVQPKVDKFREVFKDKLKK